MHFHEDPQTAADYLRRAVPLMVKRNIPTNPFNYALWYSHVKGIDPALSERLLTEFPEDGGYDNEKCEQLFFDFFVKNYLPQNAQAQDALVSLLAELFGSVNRAVEGTSKFGQSVRDTMSRVQQTGNPDEIRDALAELLQDASLVEQLNNRFQEELQAARREVETLKEKLQTTEQHALLDELTKVGNRRAFEQGLERLLGDASHATHLLLLDLDHFKRCNDTYGHVTGDRILEAVGQVLLSIEDAHIQATRYGGEEFAVLLHGEREEACQVAETIRRKVEAIQVRQMDTGVVIDSLSVSIGVAEAGRAENMPSLKERADQALYQAKQQGRNRVVVAEDFAAA